MEKKTQAKHNIDTVHSNSESGCNSQRENRSDSQKGRDSTALVEEVGGSLEYSWKTAADAKPKK